MKKKIPVGATIVHAYRYGFTNVPALLKAVWLPAALYLGLCVPALHRTAQLLTAASARDPSMVSLMGPLLLLAAAVVILFMAQVTAATELALGMPIESRFYFPFGKKLWRLIGGYLLTLMALFAMILLFVVVGVVLSFALKNLSTTAAALLAVAAILIAYCGAIFLAVRFLFLLAPASIAGQRLGVARSWLLTRGNFWRAFLVTLAIVIPVMILQYGLQFALAGFPPMLVGASAEAAKAARMAWNARMLDALVADWYITLPVFALILLLYLGVGCGAQAFAFRKLTEDEGLAPIAGD